MNDLVELARRVGGDRFRRACAQAHRDAPGTGRSFDVSEPDDPDLPHDLAELVEGDLGLAIALYRAMPCYANLMYLDHRARRAPSCSPSSPRCSTNPTTRWLTRSPTGCGAARSKRTSNGPPRPGTR